MEISIKGNAREIAALIAAIQEQPELQSIRHKPFADLTSEDFARMSTAIGAEIDANLQVSSGNIEVRCN